MLALAARRMAVRAIATGHDGVWQPFFRARSAQQASLSAEIVRKALTKYR